MKKHFLSVIISGVIGMACLSAIPVSASGGTFADAYSKDCGVALPPVVLTDYAEGVVSGEEPPADVVLRVDESLNLPDGTPLSQAYSEISEAAVPVFYVSEESAAESLVQFIGDFQIKDGILASDSPEILASLRESCVSLQGLLDFRSQNEYTLSQIRDITNTSDAKIVLLDASQTTRENVRHLQERLLTVWCEAETDEELYGAATSGCDGIYTQEPATAYDILSAFAEGTLLRMPMVVGHRGMYNEKQNTLEAAQEAYKAGADAIECDIYLTADDQIVIMHDAQLDSTTTGTGNVEEMTLSEIQQYEVDAGGGGENRPIPSLEDFFREFKGKEVMHFVEIKSSDPEIVSALKDLIAEYGVSDQVIVISFLKDQLALVREQISGISVGYLVNSAQEYDAEQCLRTLAPINATLNPSYEFVTNEQVRELAARGITVWPWTYPNDASFDAAYMTGINGITTDYADRTSECVVSLEAEDFVISATDAGAQKLTATVVTQKGEKYEVECEYLQISGSMTLLQTGDGRYYAGHGSGVVVLQYTYESDHVSYTLYSEPITITSEKENAAEPQGGCNSSLISGVLIVSSLVIISAIAAIGRKKG